MPARDLPPAEIRESDPADAYAGQSFLAPWVLTRSDSVLCDVCAKPLPDEAIAAQQEALKPREIREGIAMLAHVDGLRPYGGMPFPDVRLGDVVRVQLIAAAVPDVTAGFYCECERD